MKLAEALVLRSDTQKKLASLRQHLENNAIVQEGEEPHEEPEELMREAFGVLEELRLLIGRINAANVATKLPDGRSLMEAMARRDELTQRHSLILHVIVNSFKEPDRYRSTEIKWVACMDVRKLQKQADDLAKSIRELNLKIQETNWNTNLE